MFGIVVNKNAERFYDEGEDIGPNALSGHGGAATRPDRLYRFDHSVLTVFMPSLFPPIKADTVKELAVKLEDKCRHPR